MKYKCIKPYYIEDVLVMSENDIVVLGPKNNLFNVTTGVDVSFIPNIDGLKACLEVITDDDPIRVVTDTDRFKRITDVMLDTFERKNHDYGNSFEQSLNEEGLAGMRIRGGDKWLRFKNLSKDKNPLVKDESIRDTLLDLANYCIMTVMWLDKQKDKDGNI